TSRRPVPHFALVLADISSLGAEARGYDGSRCNVRSALTTLVLSGDAIRDGVEQVALISPFRVQARLLQRMVLDCVWAEQVRVSTVHRFQGNEAPLVILDLTTGTPHAPLGPLLQGDVYSLAGRL